MYYRKLSAGDIPPHDRPKHRQASPRKKSSADKSSRKKSRKSEDKGKSKHPSGGKKPPPEGGRKHSTKKKGHTVYSELQVNSSEEEKASKSRNKEVALAADLGWDPVAYCPVDPPEVPHETKLSKLISISGELSSPLLMFQNDGRKFFLQVSIVV